VLYVSIHLLLLINVVLENVVYRHELMKIHLSAALDIILLLREKLVLFWIEMFQLELLFPLMDRWSKIILLLRLVMNI